MFAQRLGETLKLTSHYKDASFVYVITSVKCVLIILAHEKFHGQEIRVCTNILIF
jgi:hypothetical protein